MAQGEAAADRLFVDDFERGLDGWMIHGAGGAQIQDSRDPAHGRILVLRPQGDVLATVRGSEAWQGVRIDGEVLFPTPEDSYLGVAYNIRRRDSRFDFGLIYIKGNDSYLAVNPHRDFNVARTLYEEYRTPLEGASTIRIGEWQRFAAEIIGDTCHFYIGEVSVPQLQFSLLEHKSGAVGLQPRSVGGDVWVDNIVIKELDRFSYAGASPHDAAYEPSKLLTAWQVAGPFERTHDGLAREPAKSKEAWRAFETDARGAVITGRIVDYHGPKTVAYFRTSIAAQASGRAMLHLSTVDNLALG